MNITSRAFKYPIRVVFFFSLLVLFGIALIFQLNLQNLPDIPIDTFQITTVDKGLSARDMNTLVTVPIEKWLKKLEGLTSIVGYAQNDSSITYVVYELGYNLQQAYTDVQKIINQNKASLPKSVTELVLTQLSLTSTPILWVLVHGEKMSALEVSNWIESTLQKKLKLAPGVASVNMIGKVPRIVRVELDPDKMAALGVPLALVYQAFQRENVLLPAESVNHFQRRYMLSLDLQLKTIDAIKSLIVDYRNDKPILLSEIAQIELQQKPMTSAAYFDGEPSMALSILRSEDANELDTIKAVREEISSLKKTLPKNISISMHFSDEKSIKSGGYSLFAAMLFGFLFSKAIIYIFLGSFRLSLLVMIIVPVAFAAALISMFFFNMTANMLTLCSLIILICIVVDDAIIVIENYMSDLSNPSSKLKTPIAEYSTRKIAPSILAYTISLAIIFLSAVFSNGLIKIFFSNISAVIIPGIFTSALVSLTLIPIVASKYIQEKIEPTQISQMLTRNLLRIEDYYAAVVAYMLKRPLLFLMLFVSLTLPISHVVPKMNENLFPPDSNYDRLQATISTSLNVSDKQLHAYMKQVGKVILENSDVTHTLVTTTAGTPGQASIDIQLKPAADRKNTASQVVNDLQHRLDQIPNFSTIVTTPPIFSGAPSPLDFRIVGPDFDRLWALQEELIPVFAAYPSLGRVTPRGRSLQPTYKLKINRHAIAQAGLSAEEVAQAVTLYGGQIKAGSTILNKDNQNYDIYLFPRENKLTTPDDLRKIYLYNKAGDAINLSCCATIDIVAGPELVQTYYAEPVIEFYSTPTVSLNKAENILSKVITSHLKKDETLILKGQSAQLHKNLNALAVAIGIATLLLYAVLVIQFNSFLLPLILLISQPIAVCLIIYMLYIFGIGLDIFSVMGIFLLIGIKTKNYILLITSMNKIYKETRDSKLAALTACKTRFRPILMTTVVVLLTMIPTLFTKGADQAKNVAMNGTIMLGIVIATLFSLFFVPITFSLFKKSQGNTKQPTLTTPPQT